MKNKKGSVFIILTSILIIALIWVITSMIIDSRTDGRKEACEELGFEDDGFWNDEPICKDSKGNYHFVDMDCELKFFPLLVENSNCNAKLIKIGEVWGTSDLTAKWEIKNIMKKH